MVYNFLEKENNQDSSLNKEAQNIPKMNSNILIPEMDNQKILFMLSKEREALKREKKEVNKFKSLEEIKRNFDKNQGKMNELLDIKGTVREKEPLVKKNN